MKVDVILGLQWGDEGKGKIVDVLAPQYDIIARFQGGPNAGHTLQIAGHKHILHTIPSGIFHPEKINLIGNGVVVDPLILLREIKELQVKGVDPTRNLKISKRAHLILPTHRMLDAAYEAALGDKKIGSTLKGISPCYTDKTGRLGLRFGDLLNPDFIERYQALKQRHLKIVSNYPLNVSEFELDQLPFAEYESQWLKALEQLKKIEFVDGELFINHALKSGKRILAEGAQGSLLDIDFGSYPYVTSSNTTSAGVCSGLGIPPSAIGKVFGVFKAYCTRVGSGPFPTELFDEVGKQLCVQGNEFGSTTGRMRRTGWLDLPALRFSTMINGVTDLIMMKADVLNNFQTINLCNTYNLNGKTVDELSFDALYSKVEPNYQKFEGWNQALSDIDDFSSLPPRFIDYMKHIEQQANCPVSILSVGPGREETIFKSKLK